MRPKLVYGCVVTVLLLSPVSLLAQDAGRVQDVMFEYGFEGTAGVRLFFGRLEGWYIGRLEGW